MFSTSAKVAKLGSYMWDTTVIDLLVFSLFGSEAATEISLPELKQPSIFVNIQQNH